MGPLFTDVVEPDDYLYNPDPCRDGRNEVIYSLLVERLTSGAYLFCSCAFLSPCLLPLLTEVLALVCVACSLAQFLDPIRLGNSAALTLHQEAAWVGVMDRDIQVFYVEQ